MNFNPLIFVLLFYKYDCEENEHKCAFKYDYSNDEDNNYLDEFGDLPMLNRKIFLGTRVSILETPYVVSIRRLSAHYLTGVIVSRNLVLTVAHPIAGVPIHELGLVAGENYSDRGSRIETIILIIIHPDFDQYTLYGDLAILRTYEKFLYRVSIKPVHRMLSANFNLGRGKYTGFVTGWGRCDTTTRTLCLPRSTIYHPDEIQDPMLRSVSFDVSKQSPFCAAYEKSEFRVLPGMLCLGQSRKEHHGIPCLGVPGAPLVVNGWLLGILSWGFGCAYHGDMPLVYTDIRFYNDWILHVINNIILVDESNFTSLFQVTRAAILNQYLNETRLYIKRYKHFYTEILPWDMDRHLALIEGIVHDIRDYVFEKKFMQEKAKMYNVIKAMVKSKEANEPVINTTTKKLNQLDYILSHGNQTTTASTKIFLDDYEDPEEDIP